MKLIMMSNNIESNIFSRDNDKFNKAFVDLYIPLYRYSLKLLNCTESAEDVVQECFVYLWDHRERLESLESVQSYLFESVKNRSLNYLKRKFERSRESLTAEYLTTYQDNYPSILEMIEIRDLEIILEKALLALPERCRTIFVLKRFDGKTNKEVAGFLNISVKTVENQMTIALARMRDYVIRHWGNSSIILFEIFFRSKNN